MRGVSHPATQPARIPLPELIAWQGIQLWVPRGWFLNGFNGDWREGVLTVSSPGQTHLDIKWVRTRARSDLRFHLQRFLRRLERDARRRGARFTATMDADGTHSIRFRWSGHEQAVGRIHRCPKCQCITLMQLRSASRHEPLHTLASAIFDSVRDHPDERGWVAWSLYGLTTKLPARFRLEQHAILTGQTRLVFRSGREQLIVERVARAQQLMRGWELPDWAHHWLGWHRWHSRTHWLELEGQPYLLLEGRLRWLALLSETLTSLLTLRRPAWRLHAAAWLDEKANAVFHVLHRSSRKSELLKEIIVATG